MKVKCEFEVDVQYDGEWEFESVHSMSISSGGDRAFGLINFKKKESWKDTIKWPSCFKAGCWLCREPFGSLYMFGRKPKAISCGFPRWLGGEYSFFSTDSFDLSFLPPEFFSCDWQDSLVEVKHG